MEEQIANSLKQNIPTTATTTVVAPPVIGDPDEAPVEFALDEITQYKLSRHFNEDFNQSNTEANIQYNFIYRQVSELLGTGEYSIVVAKINELQRMLGLNYADNARQRLYQWLKLDNKRSLIEREMSNV